MESAIHARDDVSATQEQIRLRMRALVEPLSGRIVQTADRIIDGTTNRVARRGALVWKMEAVPALREALFRPNPYVAVVDTWVLLWQMTDYFESGGGRELLGSAAPAAAGACRELAAELEGVAASLTRSGDVSDAREFARRWAGEHPIESGIRGRESTLGRVTERELQESFSTQEVAGNVLVTLDDLNRRLDVYGAQFFDQARWQAELAAMDLAAEYELEQAMPLAQGAVQSAADAVTVLKNLEPAIEKTLAVANAAPDLVVRERTAAVQAVHEDVTRTLDFIRSEREVALEHITREREAALHELTHTLVEERRIVLEDLAQIARQTVDHALGRLALLAAGVLVSVFIGALALLLAARRILGVPPGKPSQ